MKPAVGDLIWIIDPPGPNGSFKARVEWLLAAQFYYEEADEIPEECRNARVRRSGLIMFNQHPHDWEVYAARKHSDK